MPEMNHHITGPSDASAVLFLHGFMGSSADWDPMVQRLADRWRCVTVDLPGHGDTPLDGFDDFDALLSGLLSTMDSLNIDEFHVVGYSMGGRVAFMLVDRVPKCLKSAFIISASPGLPLENERIARQKSDEALARRMENEGLDAFLDFWYELPLFRALRWHPERFAAMLARRRQNNPAVLAEVLRRLGTGRMPNCWPIFDNLEIRLSYMAGDIDEKYYGIAEEIDWHCPEAYVTVLPGCGHTIHVEEPAVVSKELDRWLTITEEGSHYEFEF